MDNTKELKHLSLCTGYGGIDLGLSRAMRCIRTVCYVEIEAFAIENLVSKIEAETLDLAPVYTDLKTFPFSKFRGCVDILSGGFPCQPFSGAGRNEADEDPRHLFPYILKGIRECRPAVVFLENVEGIINSKLKGDHWNDSEGTPVLLHVLRELERVGYSATAGLYSAEEVGASHRRIRVFILAIRKNLAEESKVLINNMLRESSTNTSRVFPASRGRNQFSWEPHRITMDDSYNEGLQRGILREVTKSQTEEFVARSSEVLDDSYSKRSPRSESVLPSRQQEGRETSSRHSPSSDIGSGAVQRATQSSLGRDVDGIARWVDYAKLCGSYDNRTDELRLLGNGVVPATAERAFRELWRRLNTK